MKLKHKTQYLSIIIFITIFFLQGCSTWNKFNDKEKGAVIGGGSGVVLGNAVSPGVGGTIVGGTLGAVAGGVIGNEVQKDKRRGAR